MSLTMNTVGTSVPTPKSSLRDAMQAVKIADRKPSAAAMIGTVTALPNADKTKFNEALARMDKGVAERVLMPAAERKAAAEQELAALETNTTLTQPEKAERAEYLKTFIDSHTREIQSYVGTPAYDYYMLSLNDWNNKS